MNKNKVKIDYKDYFEKRFSHCPFYSCSFSGTFAGSGGGGAGGPGLGGTINGGGAGGPGAQCLASTKTTTTTTLIEASESTRKTHDSGLVVLRTQPAYMS